MKNKFDDSQLAEHLDEMDALGLDAQDFGIIQMDKEGNVISYNDWESQLSGLSKDRVIGKHFFTQIAPCTNNFMVAEKYSGADELDEEIPYVFTYKMKPTPVVLRMLKTGNSHHQYLLVKKQ